VRRARRGTWMKSSDRNTAEQTRADNGASVWERLTVSAISVVLFNCLQIIGCKMCGCLSHPSCQCVALPVVAAGADLSQLSHSLCSALLCGCARLRRSC
jgi:hypothetical protein